MNERPTGVLFFLLTLGVMKSHGSLNKCTGANSRGKNKGENGG